MTKTELHKLRIELVRRNLTQRDLAEKLSVPATTLSGWLTGSAPCPHDLPGRIQDALAQAPLTC